VSTSIFTRTLLRPPIQIVIVVDRLVGRFGIDGADQTIERFILRRGVCGGHVAAQVLADGFTHQ